jgi:CheY-like chemotaxis protein
MMKKTTNNLNAQSRPGEKPAGDEAELRAKIVVFDLTSITVSCHYRDDANETPAPSGPNILPGTVQAIVSSRNKFARQSLIDSLADCGAQTAAALNLSSAGVLIEQEYSQTSALKVIIHVPAGHERIEDAVIQGLKDAGAEMLVICEVRSDTREDFEDVIELLAQQLTTDQNPGALTRQVRVLIVDDNLMNRELAARQLAKLGVYSGTATDGHDALNKINKSQVNKADWDLALVDCLMPGMDGFDFTRQLRQQENSDLTHLPVIGWTARETPSIRDSCLDAGMDGLLFKPLTLTDLARMLDQNLDGRGITFKQMAAKISDQSKQSSDASSPVDLAKIAEILGDKTDVARDQLLTRFQAIFPTNLERLASALDRIDENDLTEIEDAAHAAKGVAANAGAVDLAQLAAKLEAAASYVDLASVKSLVGDMQTEFQRIVLYIATLKKDGAIK